MSEKRVVNLNFFWLAVAIMTVAMMHYGYSCDCNKGSCEAPTGQSVIK
jgi:hypothetical protein